MEWQCPACASLRVVSTAAGVYSCQECGVQWQGRSRPCPVCTTRNELGADRCRHCGEPLTSFSQVLSRHDGASFQPHWLTQSRRQASRLQAQASLASKKRMQGFEQREAERRSVESLQQARRDQRERRSLILIYTVLATAVLLGLAAVLITLLS